MSGDTSSGPVWFAAHTRPRCEKKLAQYCARHAVECDLPCYKSVKKYRGKTLTFLKPLFPGYLFVRTAPIHRRLLCQSDYIANLLEVGDQQLFVRQLADINTALETDYEIRLVPIITEGVRIRVKSGLLRGIEGWVEARKGMSNVMLRLDFISKAASVQIDASELELI